MAAQASTAPAMLQRPGALFLGREQRFMTGKPLSQALLLDPASSFFIPPPWGPGYRCQKRTIPYGKQCVRGDVRGW